MRSLWQDVRFGARALLKSPWFTLAAVVSLGVGIGANTTIFSLANAALLRPLPRVREESRLVDVSRTRPNGDRFAPVSYPDYLYFRERADVFEGLAAYSFAPLNLSSGGEAERVRGMLASANYFDVLGVRPARGRFFLPEEERAGGAAVAVISYELWQRRFGGGEVLGREVSVNGHPATIVGVAPEGFRAPFVYIATDVYLPVTAQAQAMPGRGDLLADRAAGWLGVRGRLKEGVTLEQARAALSLLAARLGSEFADVERDQGADARAIGHVPGEVRGAVVGFMLTLSVIVGLVLLVACANVAGMQLARAARRRREVAIRAALGATRWRITRQLLTESVLLFLAGGTLGVALAVWMNDLLMAFRPTGSLAVDFRVDVDWRVLSFTLGVSLLTGVLFGLAPALSAARPDVVSSLKEFAPTGGGRSSRLRAAFVVGQIAVSLILLVAAALCVRSLRSAARINTGFDPEGVYLATADLSLQNYDEARGREFFRRLKERAAALPGVESASLARSVQLSGLAFGERVRFEGREPAAGDEPPTILSNAVDEDYLRTLRVPLLAGRDLRATDDERAPRVALINETMAARYFGGTQDAIGKRFTLLAAQALRGTGRREDTQVEVVGVVADGRYYTLGEAPQPFIYLPFAQNYSGMMTLHVRAPRAEAGAVLAALRREAQGVDADVPLMGVMPLKEAVAFSLIPLRLAATVVGALGLFGLLLAALGVYGVVAYTVGARTREIGIRVALGAQGRDVLRLVMRQGVLLAFAGVCLGLAGSLALTRFLASLLYGVSATDPLTFASVALLLAGVALLACLVPARRATKVDPMVALRYE
jgi:putative ABC transport system permease protein